MDIKIKRVYEDATPEDGYRIEPGFMARVVEAVIADGANTINIPVTVGNGSAEL